MKGEVWGRGEKLLTIVEIEVLDARVDNNEGVKCTRLLETRRTRRISLRTACRHGDDQRVVLRFDRQD